MNRNGIRPFSPYLRTTGTAYRRVSEKYYAQQAADNLANELPQIKTYVGDKDEQRLKFTFNLRNDEKNEITSYDVDSEIPEKIVTSNK